MNHMLVGDPFPTETIDPQDAVTCSFCHTECHRDNSEKAHDGERLCDGCAIKCAWCFEHFNVEQIFSTADGRQICRECYAFAKENGELVILIEW